MHLRHDFYLSIFSTPDFTQMALLLSKMSNFFRVGYHLYGEGLGWEFSFRAGLCRTLSLDMLKFEQV